MWLKLYENVNMETSCFFTLCSFEKKKKKYLRCQYSTETYTSPRKLWTLKEHI